MFDIGLDGADEFGHVREHAAFDLAQELQPLLVPMPRQALADHGTVQRIEGRKQRGRSVALVVMRERLRAAPLQRQPRLGAIERLALALLVAAQDRAHARAD